MRRSWLTPSMSAAALLLLMTGCAGGAAPGATTPAPTTTAVALAPLASFDDIAGTTWRGEDSEGDVHTLTFGADGKIEHDSYGATQQMTATLAGDVMTFRIAFAPGAAYDFEATLDPDAQTITAVGVDSDGSGAPLTIELVRIG